ncbi:MAG: PAS domain-containing protein, partial [Desulfosalsimonas sp.]
MGPQADDNQTDKLRREAEKQIPGSTDASQQIESMSPDELRHLVHELRVHEIELRMQNDTLRQTQFELEKLQERFMELYDNAPIGFISIDMDGIVHTANRPAADLLGLTRKELIGRNFTRCVAAQD